MLDVSPSGGEEGSVVGEVCVKGGGDESVTPLPLAAADECAAERERESRQLGMVEEEERDTPPAGASSSRHSIGRACSSASRWRG